MTLSWIVTIAVIVFLILFLILGFHRGFLRIILTTFSLVIAIILCNTFSGPLADYAENKTPIGPNMKNSIEEYVNSRFSTVTQATQNAQNSFIDALPLTAGMKEDLKEKNTVAGYVDQGVSGFSEFLALNLTTLIIKLLSYVVLFLVIFFLLKLIIRLSHLVNHIPILGGLNRVGGAIVGLAEGVLFLWILCLIIMMLSGTDFGRSCETVIRSSTFLSFIYEKNLLMQILNGAAGIFRFTAAPAEAASLFPRILFFPDPAVKCGFPRI